MTTMYKEFLQQPECSLTFIKQHEQGIIYLPFSIRAGLTNAHRTIARRAVHGTSSAPAQKEPRTKSGKLKRRYRAVPEPRVCNTARNRRVVSELQHRDTTKSRGRNRVTRKTVVYWVTVRKQVHLTGTTDTWRDQWRTS